MNAGSSLRADSASTTVGNSLNRCESNRVVLLVRGREVGDRAVWGQVTGRTDRESPPANTRAVFHGWWRRTAIALTHHDDAVSLTMYDGASPSQP